VRKRAVYAPFEGRICTPRKVNLYLVCRFYVVSVCLVWSDLC